MERHEQMSAVYEELKATLCEAQKKRAENDDPDVWIPYERQQMISCVNRIRAARGEPDIPEEKILRAENLATGHVDYVKKYAWGCVQLIVGLES